MTTGNALLQPGYIVSVRDCPNRQWRHCLRLSCLFLNIVPSPAGLSQCIVLYGLLCLMYRSLYLYSRHRSRNQWKCVKYEYLVRSCIFHFLNLFGKYFFTSWSGHHRSIDEKVFAQLLSTCPPFHCILFILLLLHVLFVNNNKDVIQMI